MCLIWITCTKAIDQSGPRSKLVWVDDLKPSHTRLTQPDVMVVDILKPYVLILQDVLDWGTTG